MHIHLAIPKDNCGQCSSCQLKTKLKMQLRNFNFQRVRDLYHPLIGGCQFVAIFFFHVWQSCQVRYWLVHQLWLIAQRTIGGWVSLLHGHKCYHKVLENLCQINFPVTSTCALVRYKLSLCIPRVPLWVHDRKTRDALTHHWAHESDLPQGVESNY